MKKLSFFLMAMLMSVMSFAETELFTQTYPGSPSSYTNAYTKSFTVTTGDYTLTYTNINNGQASNAWTEIRSGSKNGASVATIASEQIAAPIDKVVINFTQANASSTNALYLEVSANSDFSSVTKIEADIAVGNVEFPIAAPAANQYYKITIDQAKGSANGFNRFNKVVFYQGEAAGEDVEIVAAPEFSVTEANFTTAFTLDITSEEGTTLKYTIDNTDPSTSATAIEVATNSTSVQITKSTAVKAIAIKGELKSVTKSKVYCYVNSAETAYTVAEAMEVIDAGLGLANELYVKGEISEIEKFDANYGSITYWIKDEEDNKFECYSGLGLNKAKFTSVDDLVVGSKVVVCGVMKKFNTIYEFNYNNYIVSLELPVAKYTVTATAENGTVTGAGEYIENAEVTLEATPAEGYEFVNWTKGEEVVSTENPYTFVVTADVALVANFKEVVVEPATETVYFINTKGWSKVNAYAWEPENAGWPGVAATKEAEQIGGYDVYSYTADAGKYANVIFNNGSGDQTANLVWTAGKYYVIDGWYTKEEAEAKLAAPVADIWTVAGAPASIFGTEWDPSNAANDLVKQEDGTYKWEKTDLTLATSSIQFKVVKNHAWGEEYPGSNYTLSIAEAGIYTITITFNAETKEVAGTATKTGSAVVIPTIAIAGDMNGWNTTANEFVVADDELTATLTLPLEAQDYGFKMIIAGGWTSDGATITRENNTTVFTGANSDTNTKLVADQAGDYIFTWEYATKTLTVTYPKLSAKPEVVTEMVGIVKRAIQNGDNTIVLTHEADGTAHIYELANGTILELVQEGVVPVDPENKGSYLAISDIALTEDGKLVANNYVRCQFGTSTAPGDGYKRGTSYYYIWNDLAGAPAVWFTSQTTARSSHGDVGRTFAVKGTSTNAKVLVTAVHNNNRAVRMSLHSIIDGVYEDPNIDGGIYDSEYYMNFGLHTTANYYKEATQGKEFYLLASPLADASWIIEGELSEPSEFLVPAEVGADYAANQEIAAGTLGNKYQGTTIVTVGEQHLMVAPYADAEGKLAGVKVLDITAGLAAATEVATANLDAAVEATAAATAVAVAENTLTITLVADATIYTLNVELESEPNYMVIEDEVTNLVIDFENMAIIGGPSTMWQVEVYLGLGQDNGDGTITLTEESSVAIMGFDARFIDGYVYDIDANAPAVKAVLHVEDSGSLYEIKLNMTSAAPADPIVVVVEDATVQIDTIPMFGDAVEYALKMTANWTDTTDNTTYPVLVEVPVYYPEATEPSEITCTVTIGGGDNEPWLGFGEGTLTITTVDGVVTAKGIVVNPYTQVAFDVTVSGKLPAAEPVKHTVTITVNPEGAGTVTGAGEYEDGAEVTVKAEENEGYIFLGWMEDGEFVAEDYEYTFTILNDVDLVAVYATQLVGVAEDLVITETALTATAILSTGTTLTVNLVLGEYDEEQGAYWLAETTTLTLGDKALTLLDGLVMVNAEQQTAIAVVLAEHEGVFYAFTLMLAAPASGVDNINTNVAPRKVIRDGQLIIIKNGVEYNVQGAILK